MQQFTDPSKLSDEQLARLIDQTNYAAVEAIINESGDAPSNGSSQIARLVQVITTGTTPADGDQQAAVS